VVDAPHAAPPIRPPRDRRGAPSTHGRKRDLEIRTISAELPYIRSYLDERWRGVYQQSGGSPVG
jgi:hypothetical protein